MKSRRCEPCSKRLYPTQRQAIRAALHSAKVRGVSLRIYPCPHSKGLHLTRQEKHGWREAA